MRGRRRGDLTRMQYACQCGYPIRVTTYWNGHDYGLYLYDAACARGGPPIAQCPACRRPLSYRTLRQPPQSLARWRASRDQRGQPEDERVS